VGDVVRAAPGISRGDAREGPLGAPGEGRVGHITDDDGSLGRPFCVNVGGRSSWYPAAALELVPGAPRVEVPPREPAGPAQTRHAPAARSGAAAAAGGARPFRVGDLVCAAPSSRRDGCLGGHGSGRVGRIARDDGSALDAMPYRVECPPHGSYWYNAADLRAAVAPAAAPVHYTNDEGVSLGAPGPPPKTPARAPSGARTRAP